MSKTDKQAPKGPSVTNKGVLPPDHLKRWKTSNLSFPTEKGRRGQLSKRTTEGWKTVIRMRNPGVPYTRLPANMRGAISDLLQPLTNSNMGSRRDRTGGEAGEIVKVGGIATEIVT